MQYMESVRSKLWFDLAYFIIKSRCILCLYFGRKKYKIILVHSILKYFVMSILDKRFLQYKCIGNREDDETKDKPKSNSKTNSERCS